MHAPGDPGASLVLLESTFCSAGSSAGCRFTGIGYQVGCDLGPVPLQDSPFHTSRAPNGGDRRGCVCRGLCCRGCGLRHQEQGGGEGNSPKDTFGFHGCLQIFCWVDDSTQGGKVKAFQRAPESNPPNLEKGRAGARRGVSEVRKALKSLFRVSEKRGCVRRMVEQGDEGGARVGGRQWQEGGGLCGRGLNGTATCRSRGFRLITATGDFHCGNMATCVRDQRHPAGGGPCLPHRQACPKQDA